MITIKKALPYTVSKKQLVAMYIANQSKSVILEAIEFIMIENRVPLGFTEKKIKRQRCLMRREFVQFIEQFGYPEGYYTDNEL